MSLFRPIDYWARFHVGFENVDRGRSFCVVGNFADDIECTLQVICASEKGDIKIFLPIKRDVESYYDDSCAEFFLTEEIRDLCVGCVIPAKPRKLTMIILHMSKISVNCLSTTSKLEYTEKDIFNDKSISPWNMEQIYEISYNNESSSMRLWKRIGCDHQYICVQMVTCNFLIYNGIELIYDIPAPYSVIPGRFIFLTCNSLLINTCSTQELISTRIYDGTDSYSNTICNSENPVINMRNAFPSTAVVMGTPVFDIDAVEYFGSLSNPSPKAYIIAIGRNEVYMLNENLNTIKTCVLTVSPKNLCAYGQHVLCEQNEQWLPKFCLSTSDNHVFIFQGIQIVWSVLLPDCPVCFAVVPNINMDSASLHENPPYPSGLLSILYPDGKLCLSYLGTQPIYPIATTHAEGDSPLAVQKKLELSLDHLEREIEKLSSATAFEKPSSNKIYLKEKMDVCSNPRLKASLQAVHARNANLETGDLPDFKISVSLTLPSVPSSPVYLNVRACPPIIISPRRCRLRHLRYDDNVTLEQPITFITTLSIQFDHEHALSSDAPIDLTVHLTAHFVNPNQSNLMRHKFVLTQVRIPLEWICRAEKCPFNNSASSMFEIGLNLAPQTYKFSLKQILPKLWPINYEGSSIRMDLNYPGNPGTEKSTSNIYVTLDQAGHQLYLRSSSPTMIWLLLQEIYSKLISLSQTVDISVNRIPLILTPSDREKKDVDKNGQPLHPSLIQLIDYFETCMNKHLDIRLSLATRSAACAVQARHLRAVQQTVCTRLRDNVPKPLNGFDTLLEASLHTLIHHFKLALQHSSEQWQLGSHIVSTVALVSFIAINCYNQMSEKTNVPINLFQPLRLLSILEAVDHIDSDRGLATVPEPDGPNTADPFALTELTPQLGLEEALELAIVDLRMRFDFDNNHSTVLPFPVFSSNIPHVGRITQHLYDLCAQLCRPNFLYQFAQLKTGM